MSWTKKLKEWWNKPYSTWQESIDAGIAKDVKEQKEIRTGLDKFKYKTLGRSFGRMTIWKEDSEQTMYLNTAEARQMLIYLQFTNSEVPRYKAVKITDPKIIKLRALAEKYEYEEVDLQISPPMISFKKGEDRINIFHTTMSVGTCVNHPKKGKTQLFRRKVTAAELEIIFQNPRQHTGKGYYTT